MGDAVNVLMQEYINYITTQVHFSVINSSLDSDESNRTQQPYALLIRSIRMTGIHLIEVISLLRATCIEEVRMLRPLNLLQGSNSTII